MLYRTFKVLFTPTLKAYFRSVVVENANYIPEKGPVILAVNHTSAFMDPIVVAVKTKRIYHFLARGEAFGSPVARWFYARLNMLPIYRPETMPDDVHKNKDVFKKCHEALGKGKAIMVFPEGFSKTERRLRPIKSGLSRIAFGAERQFDYSLDIKIVPVGINYTNPHLFRSDVYLNIGKPISMSAYKATFQSDPKKAYDDLTEDIRRSLEEVTVVIGDERIEDFVESVEFLVQTEISPDSGNIHPERRFQISKEIVDKITQLAKTDRAEYRNLEQKLNNYTARIRRFRLSTNKISKGIFSLRNAGRILFFIIGLPFFLLGLLFNLFPLWITSLLSRNIHVREDFIGSLKIASGMFVFLFTYAFQFFLLTYWFTSAQALLIGLAFYPLLLFSLTYMGIGRTFIDDYRQQYLFRKKSSVYGLLGKHRFDLLNEIKSKLNLQFED